MGFPGGSDGKDSTCNAGDLGWTDPLEQGMATTLVSLPGESPRPEEPVELHSMGSQTAGHDWGTEHILLKKEKNS